jgi:hypothetical protein
MPAAMAMVATVVMADMVMMVMVDIMEVATTVVMAEIM